MDDWDVIGDDGRNKVQEPLGTIWLPHIQTVGDKFFGDELCLHICIYNYI